MKDLNLSEFTYDFLKEDEEVEKKEMGKYKVVIADDDDEVHRVTKMILKDFSFEDNSLEILDTYSGEETKRILKANPDIAILFLDVVMESSHSGLEVVEYLREELKNTSTRIILRTGQPGEAPEEQVIRDYDINDYRLKTELTVKRLNTTIYSALRSYRDIVKLQKHKKGLEKIIKTSSRLFEHSTLEEFLTSVLVELSNFQKNSPEIMFIREDSLELTNGFVTVKKKNQNTIIAATGKYEKFIGQDVEGIIDLKSVNLWINSKDKSKEIVNNIEQGIIVKSSGASHSNNYIFIEGNNEKFDVELINLFLANYSIALDNYILNNIVNLTQKELVLALAKIVESHFMDSDKHVSRTSEMMYNFALFNNFSFTESELFKAASTMHDLGQIVIDDTMLLKAGKLTKDEFEIVKTHTTQGYRILSKSDSEVLKIAAEIALNHHEKYDGTGYPLGKKNKEIPLNARMFAIIDVFDAMTNDKVYKGACKQEEAIAYLSKEKGKHFDPMLVDCFLDNLDEILKWKGGNI